MSDGEPVSLTVVAKIAAREGVDPAEMTPPLHSVIDTDAVDALFGASSTTSPDERTLEFHYCGYRVRVTGAGEVRISDPTGVTDASESPTPPAEETLGE